RQIVVNAADRDVGVSQAGAAHVLEQVENMFSFAEGIKKWTERAEIQSVCSHADEVRGDAIELGNQNSNDLSLFRNLHAAQFFDGERVAEVHVHPGQVIHPVRIRDELDRQDIFADLLGTAVQIPEVRLHFGDNLAVRSQYQAQNAVRAG